MHLCRLLSSYIIFFTTLELQKQYSLSDSFLNGKQVNGYPSNQGQSSQKRSVQTTLSNAEAGPLIKRRIEDLSLLRSVLAIHRKMLQPSFWEVTLFCFTGISKYGSFNNTFDMIKSLNVVCFCDRKLILLVRTKEVFYVPWQYHE